MQMKMRKSRSRKVFEGVNIAIMVLILVAIIYPMLNQVALSFSSPAGILQSNVTIFPIDFTLDTYSQIMSDSQFWLQYGNTVLYTVVGTSIGLVLTTMCAYALSKKTVIGAGVIMKLIVFTLFFAGGLIPNFALVKGLGWTDTIWAVTVPMAIAPYHILIMRTYFQGLPTELEEASKIDGMGQFGFFLKIALPLSKPIIATMVLFIAVIYWNDWFSALIYLNEPDAAPVTLLLRNLLMGAVTAAETGDIGSNMKTIPQSLQAASMIIVTVPILCVYPFVQKYFVKGVMIGAVKG